MSLALAIIALGVLTRFCWCSAAARWRQFHSGVPSFGQPNCNRLFRGTRAVLALTHVMNFLAHEFSCLRRGRFSLRLVPACSFERLFFWHTTPC
jgi:hypothetical protein